MNTHGASHAVIDRALPPIRMEVKEKPRTFELPGMREAIDGFKSLAAVVAFMSSDPAFQASLSKPELALLRRSATWAISVASGLQFFLRVGTHLRFEFEHGTVPGPTRRDAHFAAEVAWRYRDRLPVELRPSVKPGALK